MEQHVPAMANSTPINPGQRFGGSSTAKRLTSEAASSHRTGAAKKGDSKMDQDRKVQPKDVFLDNQPTKKESRIHRIEEHGYDDGLKWSGYERAFVGIKPKGFGLAAVVALENALANKPAAAGQCVAEARRLGYIHDMDESETDAFVRGFFASLADVLKIETASGAYPGRS
jgi:hypothetical protein